MTTNEAGQARRRQSNRSSDASEPNTLTLVVIATLVLAGAAGSAIMAYLVQG